jgi:hypothetical protein
MLKVKGASDPPPPPQPDRVRDSAHAIAVERAESLGFMKAPRG